MLSLNFLTEITLMKVAVEDINPFSYLEANTCHIFLPNS